MMVFYLTCGVGGTLFGAVASSSYAAGPEPAMFGMLAAILGAFLMNWEAMGAELSFGQRLCCFVLHLLAVGAGIYFLTVLSGSTMPPLYAKLLKFASPDAYAGFGGFLYGICAILWLLPVDAPAGQCQKVGFYLGLIASIVMTVILVILFISSEPT